MATTFMLKGLPVKVENGVIEGESKYLRSNTNMPFIRHRIAREA